MVFSSRWAGWFFLLLLCATTAHAAPNPTPLDSIRAFISALNEHAYRSAYSYLSKPFQEEVSYGEFHDAAERIKSIRLLSVSRVRQTLHIAKARVMVETLEKKSDGKKLEKRKHAGNLVFIPEKGKWRVIQVDFIRNKQGAI